MICQSVSLLIRRHADGVPPPSPPLLPRAALLQGDRVRNPGGGAHIRAAAAGRIQEPGYRVAHIVLLSTLLLLLLTLLSDCGCASNTNLSIELPLKKQTIMESLANEITIFRILASPRHPPRAARRSLQALHPAARSTHVGGGDRLGH